MCQGSKNYGCVRCGPQDTVEDVLQCICTAPPPPPTHTHTQTLSPEVSVMVHSLRRESRKQVTTCQDEINRQIAMDRLYC